MTEHVSTALAKAEYLAVLERYTEARAETARHLAASPDSVHGLCMLARCELELENYADAVRATERALAVDPESGRALRLRALALTVQGRHGAAQDSARAAVRAGPHDWANHHTLAQVLLWSDDERTAPAAATQAYESALRAVKLAPHETATHIIMGIAAGVLGRKDVERASYEVALRLNPQNSAALSNLAAMDIDRARLGAGARTLAAGLRVDPGGRTLRLNLDYLAIWLMRRLFSVVLLSAFLLMFVAADRGEGRYWVRAAVGGVLLGGYVLVAWMTLRHLPRGARLHLRGLPRRMTALQRWSAVPLVLSTLAILVAAFAPGELWIAVVGEDKDVIRISQIVLVVILVCRWITNRLPAVLSRLDRPELPATPPDP
jgi:Tfp pilus assembly protein PilF